LESGQFLLEGAASFNNIERMGRTPDVVPQSQLGRLLADDNLTFADKARIIGVGTLRGLGDALNGDPDAIGGLLAGWATGRLLGVPGSRGGAIVDDLASMSSRTADRAMEVLSRKGAVNMSYEFLRTTSNASVEAQVIGEANALALADRLGPFVKGDVLEIQAYRQAVRNGETVLIDGRRLQMLQDAAEGVSRQGGFDMPTLRPRGDGTYQFVVGEAKNYAGEASNFSAITRNMDKNLAVLERQVDAGAFNIPSSARQSLLTDIENRNFTVEIYGNRTTTVNVPELSNQVRASTAYGSNINIVVRRVPW
jgi:hypothetical protein